MRFVTKIAVFAASVKASDPTLSLDAPEDERVVNLKCEGANPPVSITLSRKAARMSGLLVKVMEDTSDQLTVTVRQDTMDSRGFDCTAVGHAVEYMKRHDGKEPPEVNFPLEDPDLTKNGVSKEDADWIEGIMGNPNEDPIKLMRCAIYLNIQPLNNLAIARMGSHYKRAVGNFEALRNEFELKAAALPIRPHSQS
jgi:hypothetical protein